MVRGAGIAPWSRGIVRSFSSIVDDNNPVECTRDESVRRRVPWDGVQGHAHLRWRGGRHDRAAPAPAEARGRRPADGPPARVVEVVVVVVVGN